MSKQLINEYYRKIEKLKRRGGTSNEQSVRKAFEDLLDGYCAKKNLSVIAELRYGNIIPDGTVRDDFQQDYGYWEAKDTKDDLEVEIEKKLAKDYPNTNIIFEDTETAVLYQNGERVQKVEIKDEKALHKLLTTFISFEIPEVTEFRKAVETFKENIPKLATELREMMDSMEKSNNKPYKTAKRQLIQICKLAINPRIGNKEVREMLVQHILTEDMFNFIFNEAQFHRENNIAKAVDNVLRTFYTGKIKRNVTASLGDFYNALKVRVVNISNLDEKQKVLKVAYEEFYKAYNPKGADRLGIVYTPNEIVQFMIESADHLCIEHFGKSLSDEGVEILDPATGTGTFITSLLQYIPSHKLPYKYQHEIHCNEISILPYYIANLNIEYTYQHLQQEYEPFEKIVLVDTLDNMNFANGGKQAKIEFFSEENTKRIKEQNKLEMTVIIGNPPYNANQQNFNDFNKNREYWEDPKKKTGGIDERIKNTFVKESTAQKVNKIYDMYARFYRWAMDRINGHGVVAFVTNRSFIDSRTFDGFRKCVQDEFDYAYIIDTQSDVRANPKIAGTTHNVFGIQTGVAIMFLVRVKDEKSNGWASKRNCRIRYYSLADEMRKRDKLDWFTENPIYRIPFENIFPSEKNNWINLADNDFEDLIPLVDKDVKSGKSEAAIFKNFSLGIRSGRDEWMYNISAPSLEKRMKYFIAKYNRSRIKIDIKWSSSLIRLRERGVELVYSDDYLRMGLWRPFVKKNVFYENNLFDRLYQFKNFFPLDQRVENLVIGFSGIASSKEFQTIASDTMVNLDTLEKTQCVPLYTFDENGNRQDNITEWGKSQFTTHYQDDSITKEAIFHYTYAVLHYPAYREKYELNLKREFPRLPFYKDFWQWSNWGKALMDLHLEYETVEPFGLKRTEAAKVSDTLEVSDTSNTSNTSNTSKRKVKVKLKANKAKGIIEIDSNTQLEGIPDIAWTYKLGNRSALEWILDQYKEKKPRDKTIAEKFNTYQFADYKERVIDLLRRVCTVSVRTMELIEEMG